MNVGNDPRYSISWKFIDQRTNETNALQVGWLFFSFNENFDEESLCLKKSQNS